MCEDVSETVNQFNQHTKLHCNTPNYHYQCGVPDCNRMYRKVTVLKTHMYRDHKGQGPFLAALQANQHTLKLSLQDKYLTEPKSRNQYKTKNKRIF